VIGDDVLGQATSTTASWQLYDGHGSTRQLVKAGADVTSQYHFDGYGASLTTLPSSPETSLLYCGEQFDSTLNMYNLRARYYDQNTGRFNQRDTFAGTNSDPLSLHKYTFAGSDPVNGLDPSGRFTVVEFVLVTAIVVLLAAIAVQAVSKAKSKAYKQVVVNDLRQLLAYERVFSIDEIRDFTFDPLAKGIPTDINDAAVGAGGPPGGPVNTFGVDGLTDANRAQLTVEAYSFPPIEHDPPFFGNEWGVFRSQQTKSPVLVYNAYESEDGVNLPLDVSWCAVFVQDDSRFGLKAPRNRQHWYCVFAGSQTSRFFEGRYYKIPLDVQERWILEGNAWFRGSGFLELGAGQEDELIDENEY
jgi:RHS repeat-associated protein